MLKYFKSLYYIAYDIKEDEIVKELDPLSMKQFFEQLEEQVKSWYGL